MRWVQSEGVQRELFLIQRKGAQPSQQGLLALLPGGQGAHTPDHLPASAGARAALALTTAAQQAVCGAWRWKCAHQACTRSSHFLAVLTLMRRGLHALYPYAPTSLLACTFAAQGPTTLCAPGWCLQGGNLNRLLAQQRPQSEVRCKRALYSSNEEDRAIRALVHCMHRTSPGACQQAQPAGSTPNHQPLFPLTAQHARPERHSALAPACPSPPAQVHADCFWAGRPRGGSSGRGTPKAQN